MALRRFGSAFLVALSVMTLLFSRQIGSHLTRNSTFFMHWERADGAAVVLTIILVAGVLAAVAELLAALRWTRGLRIYDHLLLLLLASGLLSIIQPLLLHNPEPFNDPLRHTNSVLFQLAWIVVAAIIGFSLGHPGSRLTRYAKNACLCISPVFAILSLQLLTLPSWGPSWEPRPRFREAGRSAQPIFVFVFDGLSYERMTQDGEIRPEFGNLRDLASRSLVFRRAESPASTTLFSMAGIIHQEETGRTFSQDRQEGRHHPTAPWTRAASSPSLFELARHQDYQTALVGYYLPYRKLLGDALDYCVSQPVLRKGDRLIEKMALVCVRNLQYGTDPISPRLYYKLIRPINSRHWYDVNQDVLDETLGVLDQAPSNTLLLSHFPIPHRPYVFKPDGTYFGHADAGYDTLGPSQPEGYERSLLYVDQIVGQLTQRLRDADRFDDATIVITADHGAHFLGVQDTDDRHVPLIIKLPGQGSSHMIDEPMANYRIRPIIERALRGDASPEAVLELVRDAPPGSGIPAAKAPPHRPPDPTRQPTRG
ncbi:sulfatase-like hydrolase/transferase [Tautonia plasticadhaerens]|uniref:Sulfatase n=1 Tax=Tautonia plasticadhaerens TaxID=2527974 RepID=A0A518GVA3_9BACT|nr:sulfatase-like hydrolase/transferase [Tautonia plasticadhaerens]QDV32512.1 Sulfatase [Tautonia plasticadhaerens]